MARVPKTRDFSQDEIMAALTPPASTFDSSKITQGVTGGLDLAETIRARKQAQEDRERKLAQEIEKIKNQKRLAELAKTAAPQANISPELAETTALVTPDEMGQQISQRLFAEPKREPRAFGFQEKGRLKTGEPVVFDPNSGNDYVRSSEGLIPYTKKVHGEMQPNVAPQLAPEQIKDLSALTDATNLLQNVKTSYKPTLTGPIESRLLRFYEATGINLTDVDPADSATFRVRAQTALNDYIRNTTGAQLSKNEEERIVRAMARVTGPDETFIPAIEEAIRISEDKINSRLDTYEALGIRNIGALRQSRQPKSQTGKTGGRKIGRFTVTKE